MHAAVYVGVDRGVVAAFRLDHPTGLLACGGVVEIDERLAVYQFLQDRELCTDLLDIEG